MMISKRRRYLVNKGAQLRYMALVGFPLIFLLGALYYLIYFAVLNQMLIPEAVAVTLLPAMKKVNIILVIALPVLLFLILRAALVYSNRIVGPFYRIERELDRILAGDYSVRLKARDKDEMNAFIDKLNRVLEKLEEKCR